MRKILAIIFLTVLTVGMLFLGCVGYNKVIGPIATPVPTPVATQWPAETIAPTAPQPSPPLSFSGSGNQTTQKFQLSEGNYTFDVKYYGQSSIFVELAFQYGKGIDGLMTNVNGSYNGSKTLYAPVNTSYIVIVNTIGPWSVNITKA